MLLPHDDDEFVCIIRVGRIRQHMLRGIELIGILMPSQDVDRVAGDPQPGSRELAGIDGIAHGSVGGSGAFRAHIPLCGKSAHEIVPRRDQSEDGPLRHRLLDGLQIFGTGVEKQMHVRIDQTRKQGARFWLDKVEGKLI